MEIGLVAKVSPEIDERSAKKEASKFRDILEDAVDDIQVGFSFEDATERVAEMKEQVEDMSASLSVTRGMSGRPSLMERPTQKTQQVMADGGMVETGGQLVEGINSIRDNTSMLNNRMGDVSEGLGQAGSKLDDVGVGMGNLTGMLKKGAAAVGIAGTAMYTLNKMWGGIKALSESSPLLAQVVDMLSLAVNLFFRPIGRMLGKLLMPMVMGVLQMAASFNEAFAEGELVSWVGGEIKNMFTSLPEFLGLSGSILGGAGGMWAGAKAGGAAGAALGSIIPGAGTAIGGGIGAVLGGGAGLALGGSMGGLGGLHLGRYIEDKIPKVRWSIPSLSDIQTWVKDKIPTVEWSIPSKSDVKDAIISMINTLAWYVPDDQDLKTWLLEKVKDLAWYVPTLKDMLGVVDAKINELGWDIPSVWEIGTMISSSIDDLEWPLPSLNTVKSWIKDAIPDFSIGQSSGGAKDTILDFFGFASGGIVTGPTPAIIGEGTESEAVMPLSKLEDFVNVQSPGPIEVDVSGSGTGRREMRDAVSDAISSDLDSLDQSIQELKREIQKSNQPVTITADGKVIAEVTESGKDKYKRSREINK